MSPLSQRYYVGMSNLGFQTVYQCFNAEDDVVCERAFLPDPEDLREYQESQTPLFSLESQKPLSDFDLLAFSLSFENDFPTSSPFWTWPVFHWRAGIVETGSSW